MASLIGGEIYVSIKITPPITPHLLRRIIQYFQTWGNRLTWKSKVRRIIREAIVSSNPEIVNLKGFHADALGHGYFLASPDQEEDQEENRGYELEEWLELYDNAKWERSIRLNFRGIYEEHLSVIGIELANEFRQMSALVHNFNDNISDVVDSQIY